MIYQQIFVYKEEKSIVLHNFKKKSVYMSLKTTSIYMCDLLRLNKRKKRDKC